MTTLRLNMTASRQSANTVSALTTFALCLEAVVHYIISVVREFFHVTRYLDKN